MLFETNTEEAAIFFTNHVAYDIPEMKNTYLVKIL